MASLDQMKAAASAQGATAPAGYPGGPDQWVQDWYANAKAAGSEPPIPAAGAPSVADIRKASVGQSEDFGRFSDAQIAAWLPSYDAAASAAAGRPQFRSEGGGGALVDKPTECPPGTTLHGSKCISYEQANALFGGGYGGAAQGGGGGGAAGSTPSNYNPNDPLQARLMELMQSGGGPMGGINAGGFTGGGGAMWTTPTPGGAAPAPAVAGAAPIAPALIQGTLNAFTPNAPSAQAGGQAATSATQAFQPAQPQVQPAVQPWQPATPQKPLNAALERKKDLLDPNAWWGGREV